MHLKLSLASVAKLQAFFFFGIKIIMVSTHSQVKQGIEAHSPLCLPVLLCSLHTMLGGEGLGVFVAHGQGPDVDSPTPKFAYGPFSSSASEGSFCLSVKVSV